MLEPQVENQVGRVRRLLGVGAPPEPWLGSPEVWHVPPSGVSVRGEP